MKEPRAKQPVLEPTPIRHPFFKGGHFENMKGAYEVLSVAGATMRIRWENGEETDTEVEFQDRILDRFNREVRSARPRVSSRHEDEPEPHYGPRFRGLAAADFGLDVTRTTWRARSGGIGNAVTQVLGTDDLCFGFWAPFRQSIILWTDVAYKAKNASQVGTGFFCRLSETQVSYGFFLGRAGVTGGAGDDWRRFTEWLSAGERQKWLLSLAEANGVRVIGSGDSSFSVRSSKGRWIREDLGGGSAEVPSLASFLSDQSDESGIVFELAVSVEKGLALARESKFANDIAQLITLLLPLYRATLGVVEAKASSVARPRAKTSTPKRVRARPAAAQQI